MKRNKKKTTKLGFLTGTMSVFPFTNVRAEFSLISMTYYWLVSFLNMIKTQMNNNQKLWYFIRNGLRLWKNNDKDWFPDGVNWLGVDDQLIWLGLARQLSREH